MKNKFLKTIFLSCLFLNSFSQIKIINNGYVAIGINTPNYPLHVYGWAQLFNDNGAEIKFRANNGYQADIGSSLQLINFWNANNWQNSGWNKVRAHSYLTTSDQRLKKDISSLSNMLPIIKQLTPKQYHFIDSIPNAQSEIFSYGFLAQDVIQIIPNIVDTSRGVFSLNYSAIIPFLVGAVKEQSATIDSLRAAITQSTGTRQTNTTSEAEINTLKQQLADLKNKVDYFENNCCASINTSATQSDKGINMNNIAQGDELLLQNMPNPFENVTTIKFNIPTKYSGSFYIKIYKISGEELMSFKINKENKELLVNAATLVNGVYNYALIANSEILKMKQMIISR